MRRVTKGGMQIGKRAWII